MRKTLLRILGLLVIGLAALIAVIAVNTMRYTPPDLAPAEPYALGADIDAAADLLARAVRFETDSTKPDSPDFDRFLTFLETEFPQVNGATQREILDMKTPLYRWQGSDPTLPPALLAAHYDVVPIAPGSLDRWEHPPYGGAIADGHVWGRGTLDNKGALIAMMIAAEKLIGDGFTPQRTVYFSFGGDEEVGGKGAASVADHLIAQGVKLAWALDEGSFVLDKVIPGLDAPVASINLSEKGYLTLKLVARADGGHSSMPPSMTAVGRIARAVDKVQNAPMAGGLTGVSASFFDALGRYFSLDKRVFFANRWLFGSVLESTLASAPSTNAMLRTTTAPTMLSGSPKENVLATEASAIINFRIHPRDSVEDIIAHVRRVVDDPEVEIVENGDLHAAASPVSSDKTEGFAQIATSIRESFGPLAIVPGLTIAATDARHYARAADSAYRINPFKIQNHDLARFHGTNERLSIDNLERGVNFYGALISKQ